MGWKTFGETIPGVRRGGNGVEPTNNGMQAMSRCNGIIKRFARGRPEGVRERLRHLFGRRPVWTAETTSEERSDSDLEQEFAPVTVPDGFHYAIDADEIKNGQILEVSLNGRSICIAMSKGTVYAVQNECPHASGPLADGDFDGLNLRCPFHGWEFDIKTGQCGMTEGFQLERYSVKNMSGKIYIETPKG